MEGDLRQDCFLAFILRMSTDRKNKKQMKMRTAFDPVVLILFYFSRIEGILKESVKPLCVGVKHPNSSLQFILWQSKGKLTGSVVAF